MYKKKDAHMMFRVTREEREEIERAADDSGMCVSQYLRSAVLAKVYLPKRIDERLEKLEDIVYGQ